MRQLARAAGISHSQLLRVESGAYDCMVGSYVKTCAALAIPPGWGLDILLTPQSPRFFHALTADAGLCSLLDSLQAHEKRSIEAVCHLLAPACALAAVLLETSAPARWATFYTYPNEEWKRLFVDFGRRLEKPEEYIDRGALRAALVDKPVATLQRLGLLFRPALEQKLDDLNRPKGERVCGSFGSELYGLNLAEAAVLLGVQPIPKKSSLTDASCSVKDSETMKVQLPRLLERLRTATAAPGKKTELAAALNPKVPLESVSRWLSGSREPSGEVALQLLRWVELQERGAK